MLDQGSEHVTIKGPELGFGGIESNLNPGFDQIQIFSVSLSSLMMFSF